jgi:uncharacterized protein (TIGR00297 family)
MDAHAKVMVPLALAGAGLAFRWLTPAGAAAGLVVGAAVTSAGWRETAMLGVFYVSCSVATKYSARRLGRARKAAVGADDSVRGRTATQVFGAGGIPALLALCTHAAGAVPPWLPPPREALLAYLACCAGDTLASELGVLSGQQPRLVPSWRAAPPGRDGAITLAGTLWSVAGGALVGCAAVFPGGLARGALYGALGSLLDSLLGAYLQHPRVCAPGSPAHARRNVAVNVLSAAATAVLGPWLVGRAPPEALAAGVAALVLALAVTAPRPAEAEA